MFRMGKRTKAELCIQSVSISRGQQDPPQSLQLWMVKDGAHEQFRYAATAMLRHDKDVRDIGDGREICNHPGKANLPLVEKCAEAKRVLDRFLDDSSRNALRPIGGTQNS